MCYQLNWIRFASVFTFYTIDTNYHLIYVNQTLAWYALITNELAGLSGVSQSLIQLNHEDKYFLGIVRQAKH